MEKLIPYSLYLPAEDVKKLREMAKTRRAASFVRDAVSSAFESRDHYTSGYNKGLRDACNVIKYSKEAAMIAVHGRDLNSILIEQIQMLEDNGK
jgi:hypothetical protein